MNSSNTTPAFPALTANPQAFRFRTNLAHMMENNSISLYKDPAVPFREVLQNAVDGIHAMVTPPPTYCGEISIDYVTNADGTACICTIDNGCGMTPEDVNERLSTLDGTSKRSGLHDPQVHRPMGHFGIGNLSMFQLADEIFVFTRSSQSGQPTLEWRGHHDGTYTLRIARELSVHGTRMFLHRTHVRAAKWHEHNVLKTVGKTTPASRLQRSWRRRNQRYLVNHHRSPPQPSHHSWGIRARCL